MPAVFLHHVGVAGWDDTKKTIESQVQLDTLFSNVSFFEGRFPSGYAQCWGVPMNAYHVIRHLNEGDYVLLLRTTRPGGDIPFLCTIRFFLNRSSPFLSQHLWGSPKYPYVFFCDVEPLTLLWEQLVRDVSYNPHYDPRGCFLSISSNRFRAWGGEEGYIRHLRQWYGTQAVKKSTKAGIYCA
jgi:5-methylcytosine-specific restriction protein A